jgi:glutamine amidotransferase
VVAATCNYGIEFCAAIRHDNVMATQFHPEKSQGIGLKMLKNFAEMKG